MPTLNIPFTNPAVHDFDDTKIEISGGLARLLLQQGNIDFTEDFADDTDFTYDSEKSEFSGGQIQQKDARPSNATLGVNFSTDENANWGDGVLTGTLNGSAAVADGWLDLRGGVNAYCDFAGEGNADSQQQITVKFIFKPNYNGGASPEQDICLMGKSDVVTNLIRLRHVGTALRLYVYDENDSLITNASFGTFSVVLDQEYEIALNVDMTGTTRCFVNGEQLGSGIATVCTRSSDINLLRFGATYIGTEVSNCRIKDIIVFSTVQHTDDYTPGYSVASYIYLETSVILPEMEHTGDGTIKLFNSFSTTEVGFPRIVLQIGRSGDYLYWTGSAWAVSDMSYAQANDSTTFNTNCGSLPVNGEDYGQFAIIFPDSNTISAVDELTANMNVDIGYLTTNPTIEPDASFRTDEIISMLATYTATGSDAINCILKKGDDWYYLTGGIWTESNEDYSQSTEISEVVTNITTLIDQSELVKIRFFLHSDTGLTTPELSDTIFTYSYGGETPDIINYCTVWGIIKDFTGDPQTASIKIKLNKNLVKYKNYTTLRNPIKTVTPDESGYWKKSVIENENMISPDGEDVKYIFNYGVKTVEQEVLDQENQFIDITL